VRRRRRRRRKKLTGERRSEVDPTVGRRV